MTPWWDEKAGALQRSSFGDYPTEGATKDEAYRVALHTRQDVVLIVSYLSSLNRQVFHVKLLLGLICAFLLIAAFKLHLL